MPATPEPTLIRQASALLARHLEQRRDLGERAIWIHPGLDLASGGTKEQRLSRLEARARAAPGPKALGTLRDVFVFATGNPEADLVFVGEAPGAEEEKRREPFVGPAGELLDRVIGAMGLSRPEVYITNIVKYRPRTDPSHDQGKANRKPGKAE